MTDTTTDTCPAGDVTEHHRAMDPLAGTFRARVQLWMGPGEPHVSTGTMVNEWDLGERFLKQTYTGDPGEGPFPDFEGRGYMGYNTVTKKYEGFWIDTASTMFQTEAGDYDPAARRWTMLGEVANPQTGGVMKKRSVFTLTGDDEHLMETFFTGPDGTEFKAMEIAFARA